MFNRVDERSSTIARMHESADRLYRAAEQLADITGQTNLAAYLGEKPQTLNNWESRGVSRQGALKAQQRLGCNANWILTGSGEMLNDDDVVLESVTVEGGFAPEGGRTRYAKRPPRDTLIPQYTAGGSMGTGLVLRDQPGHITSWRVTPEWIQKNVHNVTSPKNLAIVTGFGDSMKPMYNPGDPLLVDTGVREVKFDGVYFFRIGDEGFIKRLQRVPGEGLVAISENKAYRDWTIREGMDFEVFARVVKVWRGEDY